MSSAPTAFIRRKAAKRSRFVRAALALLTVFLLLLGAGALTFVAQTARSQERALERYMRTLGEGLAAALPEKDYLWIFPLLVDEETGTIDEEKLATYSASATWRNWEESLQGLRHGGLLESVWLLTPLGEPLLSGEEEANPEAQLASLGEDRALIAQARSGSTASTTLRHASGNKRMYIPLRESSGATVAILRLEAKRDWFGDVRRAGNRTLLIAGALLAVLAALWVSMLRLVQRATDAERAAAKADRLRSLGTLTAGVAHEIRNPLGILTLEIEELRAATKALAPKERAAVAESLATLEEEVKRLGALTDRFLAFGRPDATQDWQDIDIVAATRELLRLFRRGLDPHHQLVEELPAAPLLVRFTEDALRQVLLNLLRNAVAAIGERPGTILVTIAASDREVRLTVSDDGPGMDAATAAQAFDPFFTTRADGTGLGLSLCRNLVESAGGRLLLESVSGGGAKFTVCLKTA